MVHIRLHKAFGEKNFEFKGGTNMNKIPFHWHTQKNCVVCGRKWCKYHFVTDDELEGMEC